ncbi:MULTISPECIES: glycosyltransferase [unclassified Brucella]|nr:MULTISPECIES: glycosyltransferase [unclassified Brucella]MRN42349.1 glycosyltransferase [Brucella sp. 09RB8913]MRN58667.1 glycosyltransferase [Brucella sp. 09RB8918]
MKILLLSDIPPCDNLTAGLVLSAMVRFVPRDSICCFTVANPTLDIRTTPEFANIPIEFHAKPNENWSWLPRGRFTRKLSSIVTFGGEFFTERIMVRSLINRAVVFGREQNVDRVWVVLQGQTTIRMAEAVAERLKVPLYTHVWDPFSWWAKANCLDGITTRHVQSLFDKAISKSCHVAAASEPMAEFYRGRFQVKATPIISSHSKSMALVPINIDLEQKPVVIGMAGQFYAAGEWLQLLRALSSANWKIAGRPVRIVVMGPQRPPGAIDSHVSFLGWKSQPEAALILSQCDILYCPYPFDPGMKEVSQFSFPSKLVLYLAAGRPIVFHGPDYASPARYIANRRCGLVADRINASAIYNEMERLISDPDAYRKMAANAQTAFHLDFTLEAMQKSFNEFIGAKIRSDADDVQICDHSKPLEAGTFIAPRLSDSERHCSPVWLARAFAIAVLAHYAHVRRQFKAMLRRLVLRIPRFNSLYHEIHSLYAEKAHLKAMVTRLEDENAQLNVLLRDDTVPSIETEEMHISGIEVSPKFIASLYPDMRTLILTNSRDDQTSKLRTSRKSGHRLAEYAIKVAVGSANFAEFQALAGLDIRPQDEWSKVHDLLPKDAIAALLRFILQEGFDRLIVSGNEMSEIALAAATARIASIRVSIIVDTKHPSLQEGWMASLDHIDFVDVSSLGSRNEIDGAAINAEQSIPS